MLFSAVERLYWSTLSLATILFLMVERWEAAGQPSQGQLFQVLRNVSGTALCCMNEPVVTLQVRSNVECALHCEASTNCSHFNVKTNGGVRSCELYYGVSTSYEELAGCTNYEVRYD